MRCVAIHGEHYTDYLEGSRFGEHTEFFENYIVLKPGADIKPINATLNTLANQMMQSDSGAVASGAKFSGVYDQISRPSFRYKKFMGKQYTW